MTGPDPSREQLYAAFADRAREIVGWLSSAVEIDQWTRSALESWHADYGQGRVPPTDPAAVECSLVPRAGLGAYTSKTPDGWRIAVHEHTPQILSAFAEMCCATEPNPAVLEQLLGIDARARPQTLLKVPLPELSETGRTWAGALGKAAVGFVLCHEFGHMMLGQDTMATGPDPQLEAAGLPATFGTAREEMDADGFAAIAMRAEPTGDFPIWKAGARVFFELAHQIAIHRLGQAGTDSASAYLSASYPHPVLRLAAVQLIVPSKLGEQMQRSVQEDIDAVFGRPPLTRDEDALAELSSLAEGAPEGVYQTLMVPGSPVLGSKIEAWLSHSAEQAIACVASAAHYYAQNNPYRWADPPSALGFAALWRRFLERGGRVSEYLRVVDPVLAAVPEIDELLELEAHTMHWVADLGS